MTRIVSITPNPVERDTRAFKVGASVARFGYESVVVEGEQSNGLGNNLPFELFTLKKQYGPAELDAPVEEGTGRATEAVHEAEIQVHEVEEPPPEGIVARVGDRLPEEVKEPLRPALKVVQKLIDGPLLVVFVIRNMLQANFRLMKKLPDADVYYLHSFLEFPAAWMKAKRNRARLVYDAHDANWALDTETDESAPHKLTLKLFEFVDNRAARSSDSFLTVGAELAQMLEDHFHRRPVVVRNCHDYRLDEDSPTDVRSAADVPEDAFLLVMTGAPKPGDTVEQAFEALKSLPENVHFALVGRGTEAHQELVDELGLTDRVHLLPPVPPTQVASFIRTADASPILYFALSPAYRVSLPNRFFHAIAAGLPILYPPLPEIKGICDRYELGIEVDPESAESIAAGVRKLLDNPEERERFAANIKSARDELSWEHEEGVLSDLIEQTVGRSRRNHSGR